MAEYPTPKHSITSPFSPLIKNGTEWIEWAHRTEWRISSKGRHEASLNWEDWRLRRPIKAPLRRVDSYDFGAAFSQIGRQRRRRQRNLLGSEQNCWIIGRWPIPLSCYWTTERERSTLSASCSCHRRQSAAQLASFLPKKSVFLKFQQIQWKWTEWTARSWPSWKRPWTASTKLRNTSG